MLHLWADLKPNYLRFLICHIWQAGDIVAAKARADESEGQKAALEDHVKTLKVNDTCVQYKLS